MASVRTKALVSALLRKGFRQHSSHHTFYWLYDGEKKTSVKTRVSHGLSEYGDSLLAQVRKQLCLDTKMQLLDLVECPISQQDYLRILVQKGVVIRE